MSPETYETSCYNCKAAFDTLEAQWCSCLTKERTLTCPHCLACFCKAPSKYKTGFWTSAPQLLWERRTIEHKVIQRPALDEAIEVSRPLVLVVDDEEEILAIAARVIESLGYGVIVASNGAAGLDLARAHKPDLVLTDAMMPKMDGREMGLAIKNDVETGSPRVVVMTSLYTAPRYRNEALKSFKADEYLSKPLDIQQLRATLQRFLG